MNIAFAKLGKSIKFNGGYSPTGGDNEAPAVFSAIANNNPDSTFYIVGKSSYNKLTEEDRVNMFPYNNVVNVLDEIPVKKFNRIDGEKHVRITDPYITSIRDYFKNNGIHIDAVVLMVGQVTTVTIPGIITHIKEPEKIASTLDMTLAYASPITFWLNDNRASSDKNIPIIEIVNDPRYTLSQPRDLMFTADTSLGQYDDTYTHRTIESYDNQYNRIENTIEMKYAEMEKAFLVGREKPNNHTKERSRKFSIVLNEGAPSRYPLLKEWILDSNVENLEIYGKWDHDEAVNDSRFKGAVKLEQVQELMNDTRYTFIIPIKKGWVTSKYVEMIYAGCLPFFHPTYDEQKHLKFIPKILRPKTPKELFDNIELLEKYPEERQKLIKNLQDSLFNEDSFNGRGINDIIMGAVYSKLNMDYEAPDLNNFTKAEVDSPLSLDDLF